ncbi:uncharacterized protein LOC110708221 [Chenopodium quinoa]|uniref:uncharacterized protein LOC110708221 n=1 Tax=Chenopodium quinoa TaxID=63459 RepID=UPI000B778EFD|nr:uncharacterized protein LOC110708221 [Chenopodium quinoa]
MKVLVKDYKNTRKPPRCTIKVDIRKAYDTVKWPFIENMLSALGFPVMFIKWVMACVTSPTYSIMINGGSHGFFKGSRGIRQGDPFSSLLSISLLTRALKTFHLVSGLQVNEEKTTKMFGNVQDTVKEEILQRSGFVESQFPFRYLGIPLNSKYLRVSDFDGLIDKMMAKVHCWSSRHLSYGCTSVSKCPPISWEWVCKPKDTSGLGIRNYSLWNKAALGKQVWKVACKKEFLWVKWVYAVYVKDKNWEGYEWLQGDLSAVSWTKWIWNKVNIPKHSFIAWLAVHDRLRLRDRLCRLGICNEEACLLCGSEPETLQHLFFKCRYSKACMVNICTWIGIRFRTCNIEEAWKMWIRGVKDQTKRKVLLATLIALLYHVWLARNHSYWQKAVIHPQKLCRVIRLEVIDRSQQLINSSWSRAQVKWLFKLKQSV